MTIVRKILKSLQENIALKILSVLIAIVIWYAVVNVSNPVETGTYVVRVTPTNESYISSGKKVYRIEDAYKTVTVYIEANRSVIRSITADNITVTADMTQIVDMKLDPVMVPLTASCPGVTQANIKLSRQTIPINIEDIASIELPVVVSTGDSRPGAEFEVGNMVANPETISINGPESIISTLDSVVAEIDVTGMTQDGERKATLKILNKNSEQLSNETIEDDLSFSGGVSDVTVQVELWRKVSDVKLKIAYSGTPAVGYNVADVFTTPETITVIGNEEALDELAKDGNVITIGNSGIDVTNATDDVSINMTIADKLPDNLRLSQNTADALSVNIVILSDESKELLIDVDDITTKNLADDLTLSYDQTSLPIRISGQGDMVKSVTLKDVKASLNLSGLEEGEYDLPVTVTLPEDISLDQNVTITVHLKKKATETTTSSSEES